ncbi:hypothetical protein TNCV_1529941 [Trichonephila clavipes]|uniref:Reverse transcriptase n=1 Tax=Trichonephila clavipes TaxID=2585209 RepID=A0A8X6SML6_TRICX|nr:hypothetical protein TNCV_1529941 [Trichonephila clavipes]
MTKYNFQLEAVDILKDKSCAILNKNPSWVSEASRKTAAAHFRLSTGHNNLRSHLYRIGITDLPDCTPCDSGQPMTTEHLEVCSVLKSLRYPTTFGSVILKKRING